MSHSEHAVAANETIVRGHGRIRTMDPMRPLAEAMVVRGDRIVALGDVCELRDAAPRARLLEVAGTVLPGFIDAHVHTLIAGLERRRLTITDAASVAEVVERVRDWLEARPDLEWAVVGAHFHAEDLAEGRLPDRRDLDPVSGGTALYLDRRTHDAIVNTEALRRAGIDRFTPDPAGGTIEREDDGEATGVLIERPAADLVFSHIPAIDRDELHAALVEAQHHLHSLGITGAAEPGLSPLELSVYQEAWKRGTLTLRTMAMPLVDTAVPAREYLDGLGTVTGFGDETLRIGPLKVYVDGTGGFGTALLGREWPGSPGYHGTQVCSDETFQQLADHAAERGWSLAVHTVGDEAVRRVLECFERADRRHPIGRLRFSIMHAYLWPSPESMRLAARLGVVLSTQPAMQWRVAAGIADRFGAAAEGTAPLRDWVDAGVRLAGGSDGPDFPMSPLFGMWQARSRRVRGRDEALGPRQALGAAEVLRMWTVDAAYYCFADGERGRLAPGMLADWIEVDVDPVLATDEQLAAATVRRTVVGGREVYPA
ncbi:amidohydrolase [Microbacterium sp. 18062]|uniref:amidohydrolase n=1 Tax=Microbacterium sp. 18062 TaxID=2681410 RepID=UPI00135A5D17|nr:amidohydrolase [Microbacterium sp. 18062]